MSFSGVTNFLNSYGTITPIAAIALFIIIPALPILVFILLRLVWPTENPFFSEIRKDIFTTVTKYPVVFTIFNVILLVFLCLNQVAFCYQSGFTVAFTVDYYLGVDSVQYNDYAAITNAQTTTGLGLITYSSNHRRKLGSSSAITIIYHTSSYDDLLSSGNNYQLLVDVCATEAAIKSIPCIQNGNQLYSILPLLFSDSTCASSSVNSQAQLELVYNDPNNAYFLQQNLNKVDTSSAVILSFFYASECTSENFQDFQNSINAAAVGPVEVVFVNSELSSQEFLVDIYNSLYVTEVAIIASAVVLVFGLRGFVCAFATLFCIAGSMIAALGVLPVARYSAFSSFNVVSIYILIGVGATTVLIFGSAWRTVFLKSSTEGKSIFTLAFYCSASTYEDEDINAEAVEQAYSMMGYPALFTALATYLSLFSKLASPVIVISQLGLYMGTCYILFYALFHYIIIPVWIFTSKVYLFRKRAPVADDAAAAAFESESGAVVSGEGNMSNDSANMSHQGDEVGNVSGTSTDPSCSSPTSPSGRPRPPLYVPPPPYPVYHATSVSQSDAFDPDVIHVSSEHVSVGHSLQFENSSTDSGSFRRNALAGYSKKEKSGVLVLSDMEDVFCLSRVPHAVRGIGCTAFLFAIVICLIVYGTALKNDLVFDFSIPQLFASNTNLGQALYIEKNYYPDVLTATAPSSAGSQSTTRTPTHRPTAFVSYKPTKPTLFPTLSPSLRPAVPSIPPSSRPTIQPTAAPSIRPSTFKPSLIPSSAPFAVSARPTLKISPTLIPTGVPALTLPSVQPVTVVPTTTLAPTSVHTDYVVEGSYGVYQNQKYIDQAATATWKWQSFLPYVSSGAFMTDMNSVCNYVDANQATLNVKSGWNKIRDCVYSQIIFANQTLLKELQISPSTVSSFAVQFWGSAYGTNPQFIKSFWSELVLLYWADLTKQPSNLGVDYAYPVFNGTQVNSGVLMPVWVLTNFSVSNPVASLTTSLSTAFNMISVWNTAIAGQSSQTNADSVQIIVASSAFQFPILAQEVLRSIELALIISIVGFIVLIFLFTWNLSLTVLGTVCMFSVLVITLGLKLSLFSPVFDLLDVACLVAVIGMLVDFPIHLMLHLFHTTDSLQFITWFALRLGRVASYSHQALAESVYISSRYSVFALFFPLVIILASSTPLLPAYFSLIAKIGEYILLLVMASFIFTLLLFSLMLFLSVRLPTETMFVLKVKPQSDEEVPSSDESINRLAGDVEEGKYDEEGNRTRVVELSSNQGPAVLTQLAAGDQNEESNAALGALKTTMRRPKYEYQTSLNEYSHLNPESKSETKSEAMESVSEGVEYKDDEYDHHQAYAPVTSHPHPVNLHVDESTGLFDDVCENEPEDEESEEY